MNVSAKGPACKQCGWPTTVLTEGETNTFVCTHDGCPNMGIDVPEYSKEDAMILNSVTVTYGIKMKLMSAAARKQLGDFNSLEISSTATFTPDPGEDPEAVQALAFETIKRQVRTEVALALSGGKAKENNSEA